MSKVIVLVAVLIAFGLVIYGGVSSVIRVQEAQKEVDGANAAIEKSDA
jgi:hypothetical protein